MVLPRRQQSADGRHGLAWSVERAQPSRYHDVGCLIHGSAPLVARLPRLLPRLAHSDAPPPRGIPQRRHFSPFFPFFLPFPSTRICTGEGMSCSRTIADVGNGRHLLSALSLSVFFVGASEFMLAPMLNPLADAFRASPAQAAWLVSSYAFAYAIAAPILGHLSDRVDRRRLLLAGLLSFAIDGVGVALAPTLEVAMALRIFGGLASAVIIPNAFALVADIMPRDRQAAAMGVVMLGMTAGIAMGPALAGLLTDWIGWRAPFLLTSAGCLVACVVSGMSIPRRHAARAPRQRSAIHWLRARTIVRPLLAKGLWNGAGVAAFLLSGEILRARYQLEVAQVGLSATAFGIGLGVGNLSTGALRRLGCGEEGALVITTTLLGGCVAAFYLLPLPLPGALACLAAWGAALGAGAPLSTAVLAKRSDRDKGAVLAAAETLNNVSILSLVPLAAPLLASGTAHQAAGVLLAGLGIGIALAIRDAVAATR
ncbi:MFS transporter [Achromobacter xylosoxidans]|uniref:MFS transporter n=1 Tax=Alcaligenes xylosoxydans xylosoxydans TaxID=85698 RepID=UPI001F41B1F2|nr:MFS transporter [Achromobacter xylosoxidans]UXL05616.1 MFS transporter [Achromobacter xylosoxidans]